jgi:regulator of nucleoside diphosphate kinase
MNPKTPLISENDRLRIQLLLSSLASDPRLQKATAPLREELTRATIVASCPPDTAAIDSTVDVLDLDSLEVERHTLTMPEKAAPAEGRLSILAPLGTAILGYSVGDEFAWRMPGGIRRLRIQNVMQPAAVTPAGL